MFLLYDVLRCLSNCFKCLRIFYIVFHLLYFISVFFEIFKKTNPDNSTDEDKYQEET